MNKYIIPYCIVRSKVEYSKVKLFTIYATSIEDCKEKIIQHFSENDFDTWEDFIEDSAFNNIVFGEIIDVDEL